MYIKTKFAVVGLCLLAVCACTEDQADQVITSGGSGGGGSGMGGATGTTTATENSAITASGGDAIVPQTSGGTGGADSQPVGDGGGNLTGLDASTAGIGGSTGGISGGGGAIAGIGGADSGGDSASAEASVAEGGVAEAGSDGSDASGQTSQLRAVIVRAAEVPQGDPAADHPDAITTATVQPYNTYVFTEVLAEKLTALGVTTEVFHYYECAQLSCAAGADIVVLASPNYMFDLLPEIRELVPYLVDLTPPPGVCSGLASTGMSRDSCVNALVQNISNLGINTIPGVALQVTSGSVVTEAEMNAALETFASDLIAAVP